MFILPQRVFLRWNLFLYIDSRGVLLSIVAFFYRQTIRAYPRAGYLYRNHETWTYPGFDSCCRHTC